MIYKKGEISEFVLQLHAEGLKNAEIAREIGVTSSTVAYHLKKYNLTRNRVDPIMQICNNRANAIIRKCIKKNIPCDITGEYLYYLLVTVQNFKCYVTGVTMRLKGTRRVNDTCDEVWSIDRVQPHKGYLKTNIVIMCNIENRYKDNKSLERIMKENRKLYDKFINDKRLNLYD